MYNRTENAYELQEKKISSSVAQHAHQALHPQISNAKPRLFYFYPIKRRNKKQMLHQQHGSRILRPVWQKHVACTFVTRTS